MTPAPQRRRGPPWSGDAGSVLILATALLTVALLALAVLADASTVLLERRSVAATADEAALAGAQAIDFDRYYRSGPADGGAFSLDPARVRLAVVQHLRDSGAWQRHRNLTVETVAVQGTTVTVRLRSTVTIPFTAGLSDRRVEVRASSAAQLQVGG